ncbi:MAG: glycosyltransferase family 4 protein [Deltaproteobacteria bacterium]|nr:glycosyltransferase family 4 protein [Deltaproteobacteria bacterium]MBW1795962.1 glycosyltransferase family 4 protein [Deltaproteobacteria bacterium]MBW2329372.1 glycosyltransferase family 4 protein [Deltaproteobacteria bacterium]
MNVLVLSEMFPDSVRYQRGNFVVEQIRELSKLCSVTVIAPVHLPLPVKRFQEQRELVAQIPVQSALGQAMVYRPRFLDAPRFLNYLNDHLMLLATIVCIWKHHIKVDLIHSHFAYPSGYVGGKLGQLLRKPVLLTVHGSDIHQRTRADYPYPMMRKRTLIALAEVSTIIAVSNALKARIVELGFLPDKVIVISSGFVKERFEVLDRKAARQKLGFWDHGRVILFVGNLVEIKGLNVLLEATARLRNELKDIQLIFVGDGPLERELKDRAIQLGLDGTIFWAGRMPNEQVSQFMGACDALVLPSLNEGFGIVCLEALACGRPVVASKVGAIPEIIDDPECGILVEAGNPQALASALHEALQRNWNTDTLSAHAQGYSWKDIALQIYKQYERVLEQD